MSTLTLVPRPTAADAPVQPGDRVRVPEPLVLPSGRILRRGAYTVEAVHLVTEAGYRYEVAARLDCSRLGPQYAMPEHPDDPVPLAAQRTRVLLAPGDFTAYANGDRPLTLHDR